MSITLKDMRKQVLLELEHIPKSSEPQGELRAIYWLRRMHSLGKKAKKDQSAIEILKESIKDLRKDHPNFEFKYDEKFFR
jgi:Spy/CpxP family protein refolding chaperone